MKRKILFTAIFQAILLFSRAQTAERSPNPNQILFLSHSISVFKNAQSGYGYDIFFQNLLVIHQPNNPFNGSSAGLKNQRDAIHIAQWQVIHLPREPFRRPQDKRLIPIEVARELKIDTE
jgi:hypothetical protein